MSLIHNTQDPNRVFNCKIQRRQLLELHMRKNYSPLSWKHPTSEPRHLWRVRQNPSSINKILERIIEDGATKTKIGRVGTVVEIYESKFGKRKYLYGRMVEGTWVLGGIQRGTNWCYPTPCPGNLRELDLCSHHNVHQHGTTWTVK